MTAGKNQGNESGSVRPVANHTEIESSGSGAPKKPEPLFVDWPKPKLVLFLTGQQMGYLEPCGCTGLANQKGGLARRKTLFDSLVNRGWNVVALDVGNQVRRFGRQAEIQFQMTAEALRKIGYSAVALGKDDLRLTSGELAAATAGTDSIFTSANTAIIDRSLTPEFQIISSGGMKIGVVSVVGKEALDHISNDEIIRSHPQAALDKILKKFTAEGCKLNILLAHATINESKALAQKYPGFKVVVTSGGQDPPPYQVEWLNKTLFAEVGIKGMYVTVVGVYDDPKTPFRYQRVPLDSRFEDSKEMLDVLATYQEQLKIVTLDGLGLRPVPHPTGRKFVGTKQCASCHESATEVFLNTPHANATESLVHPRERGTIQRHFDPECLSCHVTGWNPPKFQPYVSGYLGLTSTPDLTGNGCENCHGPGSAHVAAENGEGNLADADKLVHRKQMQLSLKTAEQKCLECHDVDNSPEFQKPGAFEKYWKQIEH